VIGGACMLEITERQATEKGLFPKLCQRASFPLRRKDEQRKMTHLILQSPEKLAFRLAFRQSR